MSIKVVMDIPQERWKEIFGEVKKVREDEYYYYYSDGKKMRKGRIKPFCFAPKKIQATGFYDRSLGKHFGSMEQKREYMHINGFREDGSFPDAPLGASGDRPTDIVEKELGIKWE